MTTVADGLFQYGGVPVGSNLPFPTTGKAFFVDPASGSDGNSGRSPNQALKTLPTAHTLCTAGKNDVVYLMSSTTASSTTDGTARLSATLVWSKNATHLVGVTAPSMISQRARISTATGATTNVNPLVQVTAQGCFFYNFSTFQGVGQASTDEQLWSEEGQRNAYFNVAFGGMGSANGAARAGSYVVRLYGGAENQFTHCYFGTDTRDRTAANASVRIRLNGSATSARNVFESCVFAMRATQTSPIFIDANESGCMDRFNIFRNCFFTNFGTSSPAVVVSHHASQGGYIVVDNCSSVGSTAWSGATTTVQIVGPAASATGGLATNV
jgi:hypothetical protein